MLIAFVHIEKTAGNTVTRILRRSFGTRHCDARIWRRRPRESRPRIRHYDLTCSQWVYWRLQSVAGHLLTPDGEFDGREMWFFTFLRDPLVRCASHYQFQAQRLNCRLSFDQWIENRGYHNWQTRRIAGQEDLELAKQRLRDGMGFVGLVEHFDRSLAMLRRCCPLSGLDVRYRAVNVAKNNSLKAQLLHDPRARQQLLEANRKDLELYRFAAEQLFSEQCRQYGPGLEADTQRVAQAAGRYPTRDRIACMALRHLLYRPLARLASGSWWY